MSDLLVCRSMPAAAIEPTGDGWTVEGLAVPYNRVNRVSDDGETYYREGWSVGAFARDAERGGRWVNLMAGHRGDEGERYLGRCIGLSSRSDGLWSTFRLNRDHPLAEAARSGELTGWSVSAHIYRSKDATDLDGPIIWRELCGLSHVAATAVPQYAEAGVRLTRERFRPGSRTPRLDALRADGFGRPRLDALRAAGFGSRRS